MALRSFDGIIQHEGISTGGVWKFEHLYSNETLTLILTLTLTLTLTLILSLTLP